MAPLKFRTGLCWDGNLIMHDNLMLSLVWSGFWVARQRVVNPQIKAVASANYRIDFIRIILPTAISLCGEAHKWCWPAND